MFWHWPITGVTDTAYEGALGQFHRALQAAPPSGFFGSRSLALAGVPWAADGGPAYEDWYLVDGSAALDPLNTAAVTASRQRAHDAAAAAAEGGTAGLYLLRLGSAGEMPRTATWFAKPRGMGYGALLGMLEPVIRDSGAALWCRQMTLGPTPEFCLHTADPVRLPDPLVGSPISCRPVWP